MSTVSSRNALVLSVGIPTKQVNPCWSGEFLNLGLLRGSGGFFSFLFLSVAKICRLIVSRARLGCEMTAVAGGIPYKYGVSCDTCNCTPSISKCWPIA